MSTTARRRVLLLAVALGCAAGTVACSGGSHHSATPPSSTVATGTTTTVAGPPRAITSVRAGKWSDSRTWSTGTVPTARDRVTITKAVTCSGASEAAGVTIDAFASLAFDRTAGCSLTTSKNVVVYGTLVMRPASSSVVDTLQFVGVDEARFVDHGTSVLPTDVGLWVVGGGRLTAIGTPKVSWTNTVGGVAKGATKMALRSASGWKVGDHIFVTPTQPPTTAVGTAAFRGFDEATITAVDGNTITIGTPTGHPHPEVDHRYTAEVGNLTRNIRIEGTQQGYSHVFLHSTKPQTIKYVEEQYMGVQPPQAAADATGRYALHFHEDTTHSAGSIVQGVAIHDTHDHAFVPHASDGVTFRDDLAYNIHGAGFWWDPHNKVNVVPTNNAVVDHMLIARERPVLHSHGAREQAFKMGFGTGNRMTNSVAVGLDAATESSGFFWNTGEGSNGEWYFANNLAHNNHEQGLFVWQNTVQPHVIDRFTAYYNTGKGIDHGAYGNVYTYTNLTLYGNAEAGISLRAVSSRSARYPERRLSFTNVVIDGAGIAPYDVVIAGHNADGTKRPTTLTAFTMTGYTRAAVYVKATVRHKPDWVDFVDPKFANGNRFFFDGGVDPRNVIEVLDGSVVQYQVRPAGYAGGSKVAAWNASLLPASTPIAHGGKCAKHPEKHPKACGTG